MSEGLFETLNQIICSTAKRKHRDSKCF